MKIVDISQFTHQGLRDYQEDRMFSLACEEGFCFGVFDGHGGVKCAEYCFENFPRIFMEVLEDSKPTQRWTTKLKTTLKRLNRETELMEDGCTVSVGFIPWDANKVHVAVMGDSPIIIKRVNHSIWTAPEHNVRTNKMEAAAAKQRGGIIDSWGMYVYASDHYNAPGLQMTRALGDCQLSKVLNRQPDISSQPLGTGSWVLIATDGALDPSHENGEEGIETLTKMIEAGATAEDIVNRAIGIPTYDNVTAMLVKIE